jgi:hypothetical protein
MDASRQLNYRNDRPPELRNKQRRMGGSTLQPARGLALISPVSLEAQRNDLGHGCFGICPDDDDLLFIITVHYHVLWRADILPKHLKGIIPPDSHQRLKENMYVYRMADFENLYSQMEQLWWGMFHFNGYLREPTNQLRVAEFRKLFESDRIQKHIAAP